MEKNQRVIEVNTSKVKGKFTVTYQCNAMPSGCVSESSRKDMLEISCLAYSPEEEGALINGIKYHVRAEACVYTRHTKDDEKGNPVDCEPYQALRFCVYSIQRKSSGNVSDTARRTLENVLAVTLWELLHDKEFKKQGQIAHIQRKINNTNETISEARLLISSQEQLLSNLTKELESVKSDTISDNDLIVDNVTPARFI